MIIDKTTMHFENDDECSYDDDEEQTPLPFHC